MLSYTGTKLTNEKLAEYCTMSIMAQSAADNTSEYLLLELGRDAVIIRGDTVNMTAVLHKVVGDLYDAFKKIIDEVDKTEFTQLLHGITEKIKDYPVYATRDDAICALCNEAAKALHFLRKANLKASRTTPTEHTKTTCTVLEVVYFSIAQPTSIDDLSRACSLLSEANMSAAASMAHGQTSVVNFDDRFAVRA